MSCIYCGKFNLASATIGWQNRGVAERRRLFSNRSKSKIGYRNAAVSSPGVDDSAAMERRNGRLYLAGLAVSVIGDNAMSLAAGIWVKSLTGSSSEAALVSVCVYAPSLAGPLAGVVADRVRRRRFLMWLNLVSAALVLPLPCRQRARFGLDHLRRDDLVRHPPDAVRPGRERAVRRDAVPRAAAGTERVEPRLPGDRPARVAAVRRRPVRPGRRRDGERLRRGHVRGRGGDALPDPPAGSQASAPAQDTGGPTCSPDSVTSAARRSCAGCLWRRRSS